MANKFYNNLISHWKMNDDEANTDVLDSKGSNDGVLNGGDNTEDISVEGKINKALDFQGADSEYISVPADVSFTNLNIGSISLWINTDTIDMKFAFGYGTNDTNYFRLNVDGDGKIKFQAEEGNILKINIQSDNNITTGTWYHVVITQDGSNAQMYINGVAQDHSGQTNFGTWFNDITSGSFYIGYRLAWAGYAFNGKIDDVRIYNTAISAYYIKLLYNNGAGTEDENIQSNTLLLGCNF